MATVPTSFLKRLQGLEAMTDGLPILGGTLAQYVSVAAATTTLTVTQALHGGKIIMIASTGGLTITPPAATGTGDEYQLYVLTAISGGSVTWDAKAGNASDVFQGAVYGGTTGAAGSVWVTATTSNLLTLNATTTGGLAGTQLFFIDIATNKWMVSGVLITSGTSATPFTNH